MVLRTRTQGVRRNDGLGFSFVQGIRCSREMDESCPHILANIDNTSDLPQHTGHYIISKEVQDYSDLPFLHLACWTSTVTVETWLLWRTTKGGASCRLVHEMGFGKLYDDESQWALWRRKAAEEARISGDLEVQGEKWYWQNRLVPRNLLNFLHSIHLKLSEKSITK